MSYIPSAVVTVSSSVSTETQQQIVSKINSLSSDLEALFSSIDDVDGKLEFTKETLWTELRKLKEEILTHGH